MNTYRIESKAGVIFGDYSGNSPEEAFAAMIADVGGPATDANGDPVEGLPSDWHITPVVRFYATKQKDSLYSIEDGEVRYFFSWPDGATAQDVVNQFLTDYYTEDEDPIEGSIETLDGKVVHAFSGRPA